MDSQDTYSLVQKSYEQIANNRDAADNQGPSYEESVAMAFGYSVDELRSIPEKANLGLSCGNPLATANLKQGETVIDLGSGGGLDVLLAAEKVGAEGKAIGVDMTKKMLDLAHRNIEKAGVKNASFIEASITSIPLPDATADCIISNCVINLVPEAEKHLVFKEMYRLLKPGGRAVFSDILARKELTKEIKENLALYVGCIAGASQVSEYQTYLGDAGFEVLRIQGSMPMEETRTF
ncbi:hypothetical protein AJ80_06092 [Polytolypa hystricis UAMH7299]|uniref:Arsenite methyltransferase n=1 Tax=Polytolypa hystricis (strain UAMH7299) TaxID=1447883 RepID=A0A2B7XZV1_POLH7|nr:hypothetical protein AJ80_06092 [Polytolypa hystricis UAMH7299]